MIAELLLLNVILSFIKLHAHFESLSWNWRAHGKKLQLILHWVMHKPATSASSTFLTFPLNPQWLLSDGREYTSVFHASLCGSIRICEGNPHPGRRVCSRWQLELIYPPYERSPGVWILCCRLVFGSRLAMASPRNRWCRFFSLSFRFILELKESSACERQKSMDALENNVGSTFS